MVSEGARIRRNSLVASRVYWSHMDLPEFNTAQDHKAHGNWSQDSTRKWLSTAVTLEDAKREPLQQAAEPRRRSPSSDDDLALGTEASLYGNQGVRTVQEFLRWGRSIPALSRWNSFSSAISGPCGPLSVMDILNLWNDDPEEVLLDLGFGCDEPDLSGRIPARFINHQSQARGINLQVFLEAQKNRLDLENPDVNNRFRQLEVLQQVTTAFSSLVGPSSSSSPLRAPLGKDLSPEAQERRSRVGMLFRRASKKSLSQIHNQKAEELSTPAATTTPCVSPESLQPPPSLGDKTVLLKRNKPELLETVCLSPLVEEQETGPDAQPQLDDTPLITQEGTLRKCPPKEGHPMTAGTFFLRRKSPGQARESFEMEEIQSFDESSVTGNYTGAEHLAQGVMRTNSCQSDSSGFLEEPFVPSLSQQASPGPDLIKALSGLSGGSTDSQSSERPDSPSLSSPHTPPSVLASSSLTSAVDKSPLSLPCPSPEPPLCNPSPSHVWLCLSKSEPQNSESESPPDQNQSPPYLLPILQNITHSQSSANPSPAPFTSLSPTSFPVEPASLIWESEDNKKEKKDNPSPDLSTAFHDTGTVYSTCPSVPPPALSPPSFSNLDCLFSDSIAGSSSQCDSSSGSPGNTQYEKADVALFGNPFSDSCGLSSLLPHSPYVSPSASPDIHCLPPPLNKSKIQEDNPKNSLLPYSDEISLSDPDTNTQKKEKETSSSLSFQLDKDNPQTSDPSSIFLDSDSQDSCTILSCLSPHPSMPDCQTALLSSSHDSDGLIDAAVGVSDLTEQPISQQDRLCSHDHNTDPAPASPVQDVIHVKMDHPSVDLGKGASEGERLSNTVQTPGADVYISDTEGFADLSQGSGLVSEEVCNQTEIDLQVPSFSLHDVVSTRTKAEECERQENSSESESLRSPSVLVEVEPKDLIMIESLDLVFQTSVDGSESESGDVDAFFQQLDTEGRAYWAEPIQISNPTLVPAESDSFKASGESPEDFLFSGGPAVVEPFTSTDRAVALSSTSLTTMDTDQTPKNATASSGTPSSLTQAPFHFPSATQDLKQSSRSVSVQMSSSLSSHIVHRKDVPYMTDSKSILPPCVLPLDTSTPFRALQSWTDLQIQRHTLNKKLSHGTPHTAPGKVTISTSATETTHRPTLNYSVSPYFPLLSNDWQEHDCLPRDYSTMSVSVDKGLWPGEEEELDGNGNEDEEKFWDVDQMPTMGCCCSCDHQCSCCTEKSYNKQHTLGNMPYSLDELEEMMLCLQQFRTVLSNMEEQLSEDQAAVYSALSDQDREKVRDIEELRRAVKQEAGELEMQLNELAHHYDDSLKMKMHRLLDEQSLLCSQLRVFLPGTVTASSSHAPNRTVATQCCLLPWTPPADMQSGQVSSLSTWNVDSLRQSPPGSQCICEGLGCAPTKADKLDMMGFLQRLKESLHHSLNTDTLE